MDSFLVFNFRNHHFHSLIQCYIFDEIQQGIHKYMTKIFGKQTNTEYGRKQNCPLSEEYLTTDKISQFIVYKIFNTAIMSSNSCCILKIIIVCEEW